MEEVKNLDGEQLEGVQDSCATAVENDNEDVTAPEGSPLGKFKDATSLLNAYNELQSEFTRKCQKLSELEKSSDNTRRVPQINGQIDASEFLQSHSQAEGYMSEIADEINRDESLKNSPNALDVAYSRVLEKKLVDQDNLINDENFINNKILNNNEICDKILNKYIEKIKNQLPPSLISSQSKGEINITKSSKPTTLAEANKIMAEMLNG